MTGEGLKKSSFNLVGYAPNGGKKHPNPKLILRGKWLEALGFTTGQHVTVTPEHGQLIIRTAPATEGTV
ncbi:SymE family type I addiction module toxin [Yersinia rochesterensis]|nr:MULTISPECIES: SymE family type I addiction module toxin [Yersinia]MDA5543814.1 SymE family type I addiction module toxin [Yersinia rochesterensis]UZM77091.1 type I toxin-antitoxin system SymE family toxin [Yersinia sp. SCPM-O-B-9106 (C-191)]